MCQIAAQHTADVQTAPGILCESPIFYHICSLQSLFPYQRRAFQALCLPPATRYPTITRLCPHVRSLSAPGIVLLDRFAVLHRRGVCLLISVNMQSVRCLLKVIISARYIDLNQPEEERPTFARRLISVVMIWTCLSKRSH